MVSTSEISNGLCIRHNHNVYRIIEFLHVKPGKGPAFVRIKMKSLTGGSKVLDLTIPSSHKLEDVRVENRQYQYLYRDDAGYNFMHTENFEQLSLVESNINMPGFLKEGMIVDIVFLPEENTPVSCELPKHIVLQVTHSEPGIKGNTATNATKIATLETGATIKVPLFIQEGEYIKIDSVSGNYLERSKK